MKKALLGILLFGFISTAYSADKSEALEPKEQYCRIILSLAETAIKAKQSGTSIKTALEISDGFFKGENPLNINGILKSIVLDAYSQPSYSSAEYKKEQFNEFTAKHYLSCIKAGNTISKNANSDKPLTTQLNPPPM